MSRHIASQVYINPGVRVGNWQEDAILIEQRTQELLAKQASGGLASTRVQRRIDYAQLPVRLCPQLCYEVPIMLQHRETCGILSADVSGTSYPDISPSKDGDSGMFIPMTASVEPNPACMLRNAFKLVKVQTWDGVKTAQSHFGEPIRFNLCSASHAGGLNMYLYSEHKSMHSYAKLSKQQRLGLKFERVPDCVWQFLSADKNFRPEREGTVVEPGDTLLISHSLTGGDVVVSSQHTIRNDFRIGELEASCHKALDPAHKEQPRGYFTVYVDDSSLATEVAPRVAGQ
ncbi:hypothetical protein RI367_007585 [Sorochytrium milnesiophthora]